MKLYVQSHLKDMNRQVVYKMIKDKPMTSKAEISKLTGISSPTVIKIVTFLQELGLVIEAGEGDTAIGRKPHLLTLNTDWMYCASFFLEGDFLSMGLVDISGHVLCQKQIKVQPDFDFIIRQIRDVYIDELLTEQQLAASRLFGVGIALPVIYDEGRQTIAGAPLVKNQEELYIGDTVEALEKKFDVMVCIENDTNAQTLGEFEISGYQAPEDLVVISLGTGMGAGVILNGRLRRGAQNMCGEIGYMSFMKSYVSDRKALGSLESSIGYRKLQEKYGIQLAGTRLVLPDDSREEMLEYVASSMALCINNIVMLLDCTNVVLAGKVIEMFGQSIIDRVNEYLAPLCIGGIHVRMEASDSIGIVGIASLVTKKKIEELLT